MWLVERNILSPLKTNLNRINTWVTGEFPGEERMYKFEESAYREEDAVTYPVELLNSTERLGLPPHTLKLKISMPIMILRNMDLLELCMELAALFLAYMQM